MTALAAVPNDDESNKNAISKITHSVVMVTPEMARRWLGYNEKNRTVRDTRVLKYREDMETGRWTFAGDPIRFDVDGKLQDGQHRLLALADADVSGIAFLVIRGLAPDARGVMDQGAKRSAGDQLTMLGYANASNLASAAKVYMTWERGYLFRDSKVAGAEISAPAIEQWVTEHPTAVSNFNVACSAIRNAEAPPSVGGAAFLIFQDVDAGDAIAFFTALGYGAGSPGSPINTLDQALRRIRRNRQKVPTRDVLAMFIQAWNAYRDHRDLTRLHRPKGGNWTAATFPVAR